jgi:hypothetical protein
LVIDIFERIHEYHDDYEAFCNQNCIRQLLAYYNVPFAALFINSALSLSLIQKGDMPAAYDLTYDKRPVLPAYLDNVAIHTPLNRMAEEVWEENKQRVRAGVPVITGVDIFYLHYTPSFQKYHSSHSVILCGCSDDAATLIDVYQWTFKGDITQSSFLAARSSACPKDIGPYSGSPIDNVWIEVAPNGWRADPRSLLHTTLSLTLEQYYHCDVDPTGRIFYGVAALHKIAELVAEYQAVYLAGDSEALGVLRLALLFAYTRLKLFRHYLVASAQFIDLPALHQITQQVTQDIQRWDVLMRLVLKGMYLKEAALYTKIVQYLQEVIQAEERRYNGLCALKAAVQT